MVCERVTGLRRRGLPTSYKTSKRQHATNNSGWAIRPLPLKRARQPRRQHRLCHRRTVASKLRCLLLNVQSMRWDSTNFRPMLLHLVQAMRESSVDATMLTEVACTAHWLADQVHFVALEEFILIVRGKVVFYLTCLLQSVAGVRRSGARR